MMRLTNRIYGDFEIDNKFFDKPNKPSICEAKESCQLQHGRWVYPCDDDPTIAVCSNCKGVVCVNDAYNLLPPIDEVKYCYHCGARMNEVSE